MTDDIQLMPDVLWFEEDGSVHVNLFEHPHQSFDTYFVQFHHDGERFWKRSSIGMRCGTHTNIYQAYTYSHTVPHCEDILGGIHDKEKGEGEVQNSEAPKSKSYGTRRVRWC